jgi:hypothetical protein
MFRRFSRFLKQLAAAAGEPDVALLSNPDALQTDPAGLGENYQRLSPCHANQEHHCCNGKKQYRY